MRSGWLACALVVAGIAGPASARVADAMLGEQIERLRRHIDRGLARGTPTG